MLFEDGLSLYLAPPPFIPTFESSPSVTRIYQRKMGSGGFSAALLGDSLGGLSRLSRIDITAGVIGFTAVLFLGNWLHAWYRLSHVPGPFWAAFSKYWMVRQSLIGQQPYAIQAANEKYGRHPRDILQPSSSRPYPAQRYDCRITRTYRA